MRRLRACAVTALAICCVSAAAVAVPAADLLGWAKVRKPDIGEDADLERLAREIDWLERRLDTYGSAVPKHPDVWGEARMTKHRQEFERLMAAELDDFRDTLNASIRRSDQAFLGMAAALGAGTEPTGKDNVAIGLLVDPAGAIDRTPVGELPFGEFELKEQGLSLEPTEHVLQMDRYLRLVNELRRINEGDDTADSPGYAMYLVRIPVSILPGKKTRTGYGAEVAITVDSELTEELLPATFRDLVINDVVDQLGLGVTKALDSPGLIAALEKAFDELHDETKLRARETELKAGRSAGLAERMNGLQAQLQLWENDSTATSRIENELQDLTEQRVAIATHRPSVDEVMQFIAGEATHELQQILQQVTQAHLTARARTSLFPYPTSQVRDIFGSGHVLGHIILDAKPLVKDSPIAPRVNLLDVQAFLRTELHSAYRFLQQTSAAVLWRHCTPELAGAIQLRKRKSDTEYKYAGMVGRDPPSVISLRDAYFDDIKELFPRAAHTTTVSLAWAILVESALLNDRLMEDMHQAAVERGCPCACDCEWLDCYLPDPSPAAREAFQQYVECRWPIQVFAVEPAVDEQNVAETYSRRRELQLAVAIAVSQGKIGANGALQFMRRLETDIDTITLNRTAVGFSHGDNTFGWRFYPRVQAPHNRGTVCTFWETLCGSTGPDADLRTRQIEPGIRECVALVFMPSFVPHARFHMRSHWFGLTNPRDIRLSLAETLELGQAHQSLLSSTAAVEQSACYRPEDIAGLLRTVEQLGERLPIQDALVQVPFENTLGGFEMFTSGVTDLAPELHGFYGEPGVYLATHDSKSPRRGPASAAAASSAEATPSATVASAAAPATAEGSADEPCTLCSQCEGTEFGTTLFLVGDRFSVHDTKVIAGGRCVPFILLSRQIMQVTIPAFFDTVEMGDGDDRGPAIDVHVATPYGVSNHLLIPVVSDAPPPPPPPPGSGWVWKGDNEQDVPMVRASVFCRAGGDAGEIDLIYHDRPPLPPKLFLLDTKGRPLQPTSAVAVFDLTVVTAAGERKLRTETVTLSNEKKRLFANTWDVLQQIEKIIEEEIGLSENVKSIQVGTTVAFPAWPNERVDNVLSIEIVPLECPKVPAEAHGAEAFPPPLLGDPAELVPTPPGNPDSPAEPESSPPSPPREGARLRLRQRG
jgi:hypothetical protein